LSIGFFRFFRKKQEKRRFFSFIKKKMPQIFSEIPLHLIFESSVSFCCEKKSASQPETAVPLSKTALQAKSKTAKTTAIVPNYNSLSHLRAVLCSPFPLIETLHKSRLSALHAICLQALCSVSLIFEKAYLTFASPACCIINHTYILSHIWKKSIRDDAIF